MSDELNDKDPFEEPAEPDKKYLISEAMVKKATFLIHKLANRKKQDYKEIQNKCKKLFSYTNLAKVSMDQGHAIINKLIELTGGEEKTPATNTTVKDDLNEKKTVQELKHEKKEEIRTEEDVVTATMRKAIRAAVDITQKEVIEKDIPVMGLGGFVLEVGKVLFEAKMSEDTDK